jgi:zinc protease
MKPIVQYWLRSRHLATKPRLFRQLCGALALALVPMLVVAQSAQRFELANGLTVLVLPDHRAPTAVHMVWMRAGAMDEVDGVSGVAHVLEHMMFKGTATLAAGEFSRRVAALGGQENAFTSRDYTAFYQQVPVQKLAQVVRLEADRMQHNQWSDDEFRKELEVVKEERRLRTEDSPQALLAEQLNATAFVASPYRRPVVGWMSDLESLSPADVRNFYQRWYAPNNAAVVVVGDVQPQEVLRLVESAYGAWPRQALPARKPRQEPEQKGLKRLAFKAPAEQALVSLTFKVPAWVGPADPATQDALALTVLAAVLDGYAGARLERALTQGADPLAHSVGAVNGLWGRGPQVFQLMGVPASGKSPQQVEQALRQQVQRVAQEGVSAAELARVKAQWLAGQVYKRDSMLSQARELGSHWAMGLPDDADEQLIAGLRAVTADQVQAVAAKYFGDDQLTAAHLLPQPLQGPRLARRLPDGLRH